MDCWQTLGIEATADKRAIKRAYAKLIKQNNPEDKPQEYQEIREAYDQALAVADYLHEDELLEDEQPAADAPEAPPVDLSTQIDADEAVREVTLREKEKTRRVQDAAIERALTELLPLLRRDEGVAIASCRATLKTEFFQALDVRYEFEGRLLVALLEHELLPFSFLQFLAEAFQWDIDMQRPSRMVISHFDEDSRYSRAFDAVANHYLGQMIRSEVRIRVQNSHRWLPAATFDRLDALLFTEDREQELAEFCKVEQHRELVEMAYEFLQEHQFVPPYIAIVPWKTLQWLARHQVTPPPPRPSLSPAKGSTFWNRWATWFLLFLVLRGIVLLFSDGGSRAPDPATKYPDIYNFPSEQLERIDRLQKEASSRKPEAQYELGLEYLAANSPLTRDPQKALGLLRSAANQGYAPAQERLGVLYYTGEAGVKDYQLALEMLTPAADRDQPDAVFWLSRAFEEGKGVAVDNQRSRQLLDRAAELGSADGLRVKGMLLIYGAGEKKNTLKGVEYLRGAIEKGNLNAAYQLALEYLSGEELDRNDEQARRLMEMLATKGAVIANFWLSQFYARGWGVPQDTVEAQRLLTLARGQAGPDAINQFAWILATNHNDTLRDGALAVELMEALLRDPQNNNAQRVDTLAAAYAATGNFAKAAQTQRSAIDLLATVTLSADARKVFEARLKRYQEGRAYVE